MKRWLQVLVPVLLVSIWYGSKAVGYVSGHRALTIASGSMAPALLKGDRVFFDVRASTPRRREVWSFHGPKGTVLVERVIGLPGETVEVAGGKVLVDGKALDEPYLAAPMTYTMPPVRLGRDQFFMLGDSRNGSLDSHIWGPLARTQFVGRAEDRFWPRSRIGPVR